MYSKDKLNKLDINKLATKITSQAKVITNYEVYKDELTISVKPKNIEPLFMYLKDNNDFKFDMLIDITAVDYPKRSKRFEVVYNLLSIKDNLRIRVKTFINDNEPVPSLTEFYKSASWYEREVWDMYGITFQGNNDLRRLLTDYGFEGHPLRKDFPLTGFLELRYDETKKKVSYSKVKLTQDYRNFDFLSPWEGNKLPGDEKFKK